MIVARINLENIIGKHFRQPDSDIMPREKSPLPLPGFPPPQWNEAGTGVGTLWEHLIRKRDRISHELCPSDLLAH